MPENYSTETRKLLTELADRRKKYMTDTVDMREEAEQMIRAKLAEDKTAYERIVVKLRGRTHPVTVAEIGRALGTKNRATVYEILARQNLAIDIEKSNAYDEENPYSWVFNPEYSDFWTMDKSNPVSYGQNTLYPYVETFHTAHGWHLKVDYDQYGDKEITEHQIYAVDRHGIETRGWRFTALLPLESQSDPLVEPKIINTRVLQDEDNAWQAGFSNTITAANKRRAYYTEASQWVKDNPKPEDEPNNEGGF